MKRLISLLFLMVFSVSAIGEGREEKIKKLMEAQGLVSMFESQLEMGKAKKLESKLWISCFRR